jgi:quercetin dioxygenase-like cupin family protein
LEKQGTKERKLEIQPKLPTTKGPSETFVGDVWLDVIAKGDGPSRVRVYIVRFAPGARNAWHRHANGQTLYVTEGHGLVQSRGADVTEIGPSDTVYTPPGEWHWHGAAAEHFMSHFSFTEGLSEGQQGPETEWGGHITDAEYGSK